MGAGKRRRVILASTAAGAALVAGTSIGLAGGASAAGASKAKAATGHAKPRRTPVIVATRGRRDAL